MNEQELSLWVRINGASHAFGRELGCDCERCRTVNLCLERPPERLTEFNGWSDPPVRANTSASLLVGDASGAVVGHLLLDVGSGVVDGLAASLIPGLGSVSAVLLTHWHYDHIGGLNQLGESLRRTANRYDEPFFKIPLYCTLATYDALRERWGFGHLLERCYRFQEIVPEDAISIKAGPATVGVTPLPAVHGNAEGAVTYVAQSLGKKTVFAWDLESPEAAFPDGRTNLDVFRQHAALFQNADLHVQECNTWAVPGRGHSTYRTAEAYFEIVAARRTLVTHLSGHEDGPGNPGYGWTEEQWQAAVERDARGVARQGMLVRL